MLFLLLPYHTQIQFSYASVICSEEPRQCEPLDPPAGSEPGDRVLVDGYETGDPEAVLNPKKKVWEKLQEELRVSASGNAEWQGNSLLTERGQVTAKTLRSVPIK